ncbi:hypothetical protein J5Y04_15025 [Kitasatospora sp. RG8]|uniref:hypothetical protein n=1 Tax=Kitasatospora sp. RG8 TaxID=2820815 RepID=UPI001AE0DBCA|nr:hypothetical protein [Kitasatospora sp. RG8]MBP0450849.1 hypothetical protein [Kitasatospora sp. RG8]
MGTVGRKVAAVAATGVLLGVLAACGSGGSKTSHDVAAGGASPAAGATAGAATTAPADAGASPAGGAASATSAAASAPGAAAGTPGTPAPGAAGTPSQGGGAGAAGGGTAQPAGADSDTLLLDDRLLLQLMPDQKAMTGWEEEKRRVDTADHATTCSGAGSCTGKPLSGTARFSSGEVTARFGIDTLPSKAAAKDRLAEAYAAYGDAGKYHTVDLAALGSESRVFQGQLAGRDGVTVVLRSGTVVATVTTEGGPVDPAATRRLAAMLVQRVEQAQAGRTPDAVLGTA